MSTNPYTTNSLERHERLRIFLLAACLSLGGIFLAISWGTPRSHGWRSMTSLRQAQVGSSVSLQPSPSRSSSDAIRPSLLPQAGSSETSFGGSDSAISNLPGVPVGVSSPMLAYADLPLRF